MAHELKRRSEQVTGVSNVAYNAVTVLSNRLQASAVLEQYKRDAEETGDREALELFERLQQHELEGLEELKRFVAQRLR
jgi:uncharacterized membrane-anchored protein